MSETKHHLYHYQSHELYKWIEANTPRYNDLPTPELLKEVSEAVGTDVTLSQIRTRVTALGHYWAPRRGSRPHPTENGAEVAALNDRVANLEAQLEMLLDDVCNLADRVAGVEGVKAMFEKIKAPSPTAPADPALMMGESNAKLLQLLVNSLPQLQSIQTQLGPRIQTRTLADLVNKGKPSYPYSPQFVGKFIRQQLGLRPFAFRIPGGGPSTRGFDTNELVEALRPYADAPRMLTLEYEEDS